MAAGVLVAVAALSLLYQIYNLLNLRWLVSQAGQGDLAACGRLCQMGPRAVGPLVWMLRDNSPRARAGAALILGQIAGPGTARALIDSLKDPCPQVRSRRRTEVGRQEALKEPASAKGNCIRQHVAAHLTFF